MTPSSDSVNDGHLHTAVPRSPEDWLLIEPIGLMVILLHHRRTLVIWPLILFALVVGIGLFQDRTYTSTAAFRPAGGGGQSGQLRGLAMEFGINLAGGDEQDSPEFYEALVRSPELLRLAVNHSYNVDGVPTTLISFYEVEGDARIHRQEAAVERLRRSIKVEVGDQTGIVRVHVETTDPDLTRQVTSELLQLLEQFHVKTQQAQAAAERQFVEERLAEVRDSITAAEEDLQRFLRGNREFSRSPELQFEYDRLQRTLVLQQQLQTSLAQAYEQARIEEVRNTPVITILETPIRAVKPDRRGLTLRGLLALLLGGLLALMVVTVQEVWSRILRINPGEAEKLRGVLRHSLYELRHPFRRGRTAAPTSRDFPNG